VQEQINLFAVGGNILESLSPTCLSI